MKKIEDYCVPDLVGTNPKWIFVLESPHKEEISLGYPAADDSGRIMSEVLLDSTEPFGRLFKENDPIVGGYSVMNASCIPLQKACYNEPHLRKEIAEISNARHHTNEGVFEEKKAIKHALDSQVGKRITQNLKTRVMRQLESNPHGVFIVCGVVAQAIFEVAINTGGWYHETKAINFEGKKTTVFYENHPSALSGERKSKWQETENIKQLLHLLAR